MCPGGLTSPGAGLNLPPKFRTSSIPRLPQAHVVEPQSPSEPPPEGSPSRRRPLRRVAQALAFAMVFVAVAAVGLVRPPSPEDWPLEVAGLFEALESERERVNAVFIGSSYTGYHLDRDVLVRAAADQGLELHPVILALPALEAFEADAVVDRVLEMELPRLRWIVIEYSEWEPDVIEEEFRGSRLVWWQSPRRTGRLMKAAWAEARDDEDADDAIPLIARAAAKLAVNYSRVGNVSESDREKNQTMTEARRAAYARQQLSRRFVPEYLEDLEDHRDDLMKNGGWKDAEASRLRRLEARMLEDQIGRIRNGGAEPVYFLPPSLIDRGVRPEAPILNFDDPEAYPEFFKPGNRLDAGHMSESQIEPFSRRVAEVFAGQFGKAGTEPMGGAEDAPPNAED